MTALQAAGLRIAFGEATPVKGITLSVARGECLAIVGESGAGKSLTARALLGLAPDGARVTADELTVDGVDARDLDEGGWRRLRGARIALVSQDALVSLDPLRRIGAEVAEPLLIHDPRMPRPARHARVESLLTDVAIPEPGRRARQHPHELSGGLRQRALIASALAGDPAVLIADEPTTALDATVQARVLELLRSIADRGTAVVFVSHDFAAVRRVADRVAVMRDGEFVEEGATADVLDAPQHPYTRQLVAASRHVPRAPRAADDADVAAADPVVVVDGVSKAFDRPAVQDVSFTLARGRTLGVVGESGSGKTTLARMIVGVERPDAGTVQIGGVPWSRREAAGLRRRVQLVHQNPLGAFDPRWSVGRSLREALAAGGVPRAARQAGATALLAEVGLDAALARRRPAELSGGQRQRAAIARALAVDPDVLVLDEPVSALDPTVRERVLALLRRLQEERHLTMIFVSHDLDVVAAVADDVLVMQDGVVVEAGAVAEVFATPRHPFTRELLAAGR
ncbi:MULTISPECIES: ABC transporter ATP-binding protein [unclassified Microbacterium]|uniref:dipeptide ABC transporter ATP-binding protein n=1 Tax=unclassified Microbacterium TaxID=2609290 RepID=UPI00214D0E02|nr:MULTISPECIES: ABC transporter ATP-binding protein [unclassified Microbacterium]MCR2785516.1 ABC transporter ATP-binding protein [Microbacterium sp. zg.B96]WIM17494.1 ABC transporter ATP-binding protein [Microbacterium sp. zg-B96]